MPAYIFSHKIVVSCALRFVKNITKVFFEQTSRTSVWTLRFINCVDNVKPTLAILSWRCYRPFISRILLNSPHVDTKISNCQVRSVFVCYLEAIQLERVFSVRVNLRTRSNGTIWNFVRRSDVICMIYCDVDIIIQFCVDNRIPVRNMQGGRCVYF